MTTNNSIYIPQVFASLSKQKIVDTFLELNIGHVSHVKLVSVPKSHGPPVNKAYVYIDQWTDSDEARDIQHKLFLDTASDNRRTELHYAKSKYWILLPNNDRSMQLASTNMTVSITTAVPTTKVAGGGPLAMAAAAKMVIPTSVVKRQLGISTRTEMQTVKVLQPTVLVRLQQQAPSTFQFSGTYELSVDGEMYEFPIPADIPDPDIDDEDENIVADDFNPNYKIVSADYAQQLEFELAMLREHYAMLQSNCNAWTEAYHGLEQQQQMQEQHPYAQMVYQMQEQQQMQEQSQVQDQYNEQQHSEWLNYNIYQQQEPQQLTYCM